MPHIAAEAARIRPIAEAAAKLDGQIAFHNHGVWFGEPENQLAIIALLSRSGIANVGLVHNLHHSHDQLARFPALLAQMKPHLLALNLTGTVHGGDKQGQKNVPLAQGKLDARLLTTIRNSDWHGPIGILNTTNEDPEGRLQGNPAGLDWLWRTISGQPAGERPIPRTWRAKWRPRSDRARHSLLFGPQGHAASPPGFNGLHAQARLPGKRKRARSNAGRQQAEVAISVTHGPPRHSIRFSSGTPSFNQAIASPRVQNARTSPPAPKISR